MYSGYTYDATKGVWVINSSTITNMTVSDTAPSNPLSGDSWFDSTTGYVFVYYTDADSSQWVQTTGAYIDTALTNRVTTVEARTTAVEGVNTTQNGFLVPTGCIMQWATNTPPSGWLLCDGQSTSGYAALASIVGASVPDLRGRVPVGRNSGTFGTLGATGGAETVTLTNAQLPDIPINIRRFDGDANDYLGGSGNPYGITTPYTTGGTEYNIAQTRGGGGAHTNLQPYIVLNYIIKT
jgi:microcystin-dependent protein